MAINPRLFYDIHSRDMSQAGWDQAKHTAQSQGRQIGRLITQAFAVTGIASFGNRVVQQADELGKLADQFDITVESASRLNFAFERNNLSVGQFSNTLRSLGIRVQEAANGNREYADAFRDLGLEASELQKLGLDDQFRAVTEALADSPDRMRIAARVLGDEVGAAVLRFAGDVRDLEEEAISAGAQISGSFAETAAELNDSFTNATATVENLFRIGIGGAVELTRKIGELVAALATGLPSSPLFEAQTRFREAELAAFETEQRIKSLREQISSAPSDTVALFLNEQLDESNALLDEQLVRVQEIGKEVQSLTSAPAASPEEGQVSGESTRQQREREALAEREAAELESLRRMGLAREEQARLQLQDQIDRFRELSQARGDSELETNITISSIRARFLEDLQTKELAAIERQNEARIREEERAQREIDRLAEQQARDRQRTIDDLGGQTFDTFQRSMSGVEGAWRDTLGRLAQDLLRSAFLRLVSSIFGGGVGVAGAGTPIISAADGASFLVNSSFPKINAGRDNRFVAIAARDNERVTVSKPGQSAGGQVVKNVTVNIDARGNPDVASQTPALVQQAMRVARAQLDEDERRGLR